MPSNVGPLLQTLLTRYGLTGLMDWASEMVVTGASEDEIIVQLYEQQALHDAYPWIREREAAGLTPQTIEEFLTYKNTLSQNAKLYGINVTTDEINKLFAGDVSVNEAVEDRIAPVASIVHMLPAGVRAQVENLYGITTEDLQRTWMDPKENAQTLRKRLVAAQIANEGMASAFGQINAAQAERLGAAGFDAQAAQEAFGRLVQQRELFQQTDATDTNLDTDTAIAALTGDQNVVTELQRRAQRRAGRFEEGGDFATSQRGIVGLGAATRR